jgi:hypothetical protein
VIVSCLGIVPIKTVRIVREILKLERGQKVSLQKKLIKKLHEQQ